MTKERKKKGEKVCEIVKIGKDEKVIETCGVVPEEKASKKQIKEQKRILRNFLIILGVIALLIIGMFFGSGFFKKFSYRGLEFDIQKYGEMKVYHTSFPVYSFGEQISTHNVFLRNDPRKLEKNIKFDGELTLTPIMAVQGINDFNCEGKGVASQAAFEQVVNAFGTNVIYDPSAECDDLGRYNLLMFIKGNETKIESISSTCHIAYVKDCEIFEAKERFLIQEFINWDLKK